MIKDEKQMLRNQKNQKMDEKEMLENLYKATDKYEADIAMQPFTDSEIENRKHQFKEHYQRVEERENNRRQQLADFLQKQKNEECEIDIRHQQYSNLCFDNLDNLILDCLEAQTDDEIKLTKELELLTACVTTTDYPEMLLSTLLNEQYVNLTTVDPKSQSDIDRMDPKDA